MERIINVLEIVNGIPSQIESFPILEEQLSQDVVEEAEEFFVNLIKENNKKFLPEEDEVWQDEINCALEEGVYDDRHGYEVYLIWSN